MFPLCEHTVSSHGPYVAPRWVVERAFGSPVGGLSSSKPRPPCVAGDCNAVAQDVCVGCPKTHPKTSAESNGWGSSLQQLNHNPPKRAWVT